MPSTDIDGSVIIILSEEEARMIYRDLRYVRDCIGTLNDAERRIAHKIARDLALQPEELL
jgi:hypothetical protein